MGSADLQKRVQGQLHRCGVAPRVGHQSSPFDLVPVDLSQPIYCLLLQLLGLVLPTVPASTGSNRPKMTTVAGTMGSTMAPAGAWPGSTHATFTLCLPAHEVNPSAYLCRQGHAAQADASVSLSTLPISAGNRSAW